MWFKSWGLLALVCVWTAGSNAQIYGKDIQDAKTMQELLAIAEKEVSGFADRIFKNQDEIRTYIKYLASRDEDFVKILGNGPERCKLYADAVKQFVEERKKFLGREKVRDYAGELTRRADVQAIFQDMNKNLEQIRAYLDSGSGSIVDVKHMLHMDRTRFSQLLIAAVLQLIKDVPSFYAFNASVDFIKCTLP